MFVRKAFQFRLCPTKSQARLLQAQLDECRWRYNELLAERKIAHEELDLSLTKDQQLMFLPVLKEERKAKNQFLNHDVYKLKKGTKERRKAGKAVAKIHQRIKNQRKDFCHKQTKKIIEQYQSICIEDLNIKNMIEGSHFGKNRSDASWNQFF